MDLAHDRLGRGPTLVVIRQLEKALWEPVVERLAREREVVAVDLPGTGDSSPLPAGETPSPEALAGVVATWFRSAGLERPHVAGNSLGGGRGDRAGLVAGNPFGRTLAFGQLAARPWRIPGPVAAEMLRGMARAPGFDATAPAVGDYRMRGLDDGVPVTIAWGQLDLLTPLHQRRRAARLLPEARHVALRGCGHSPMVDDPDQVARVLLDASPG